jgi:glycosyltransferase involved in cell wall biosynthesis
MPVYNGERFIRETLDSILAQTYGDYELIISDNGSTDATRTICESYASRDPRIRYHREEENRGAAWNYNRVAELASGEYFKWAAHDDLYDPEYLERCVQVLAEHPDVVLAYPDDIDIDDDGNRIDRKRQSHIPSADRAASSRPSERFRNLVRLDYDCEQVFGLIRRDLLIGSLLIGSYTDSDRTLLAELGLYGTFREIPEPLFLHRHHESSSCRANPIAEGWHQRASWFDPDLKGQVLYSQWHQLREYMKAVLRSPLGVGEKALCFFWLAVRYRTRVPDLIRELRVGFSRRRPGSGSIDPNSLTTRSKSREHTMEEVS